MNDDTAKNRPARWRAMLGVLAALVVLATGAITIEGGATLTTAPAYLAASSGGQSTDLDSPVTANLLAFNGNPEASVYGEFSAAGATCAIHVLRWVNTGTLAAPVYRRLGIAEIVTMTATSGPAKASAGTLYPSSETLGFSQRSASHIEFRLVGSVSSGTVRLCPWAHSANPGGQ